MSGLFWPVLCSLCSVSCHSSQVFLFSSSAPPYVFKFFGFFCSLFSFISQMYVLFYNPEFVLLVNYIKDRVLLNLFIVIYYTLIVTHFFFIHLCFVPLPNGYPSLSPSLSEAGRLLPLGPLCPITWIIYLPI